MDDLTPANQNPWYVLATLYGEQEGEEIDWELDKRNRRVWNAWAGQKLSLEQESEVAKNIEYTLADIRGWGQIADEVEELHKAEMFRRNGPSFVYPGLPSPKEYVEFRDTVFGRPATFCKRVIPSTFLCLKSSFHRVAVFDATVFVEGAGFISSHFYGDAFLQNSKSLEGASFDACKFEASAHFGGIEVLGHVSFKEVEFGTENKKSLSITTFPNTKFKSPVSFRLAKFHQNFPDLSGAILHDTTTFTARDGHWPEQIDQPDDQDALIAARESAATIRHVMGKQGLPEEEHFFFRKEMGFARQIGPLWQRLPYIGFGVLSDYGYSIARPFAWLACLFAYPLGFYGGYLAKDGAAIPAQITGALGLAFSSTFNFFGFQRTYFREELAEFDTLMSFLSGSQTVFGYILLFFLALGLRQRFRLR